MKKVQNIKPQRTKENKDYRELWKYFSDSLNKKRKEGFDKNFLGFHSMSNRRRVSPDVNKIPKVASKVIQVQPFDKDQEKENEKSYVDYDSDSPGSGLPIIIIPEETEEQELTIVERILSARSNGAQSARSTKLKRARSLEQLDIEDETLDMGARSHQDSMSVCDERDLKPSPFTRVFSVGGELKQMSRKATSLSNSLFPDAYDRR